MRFPACSLNQYNILTLLHLFIESKGSYIAGSLLKDRDAAIVLCQLGLQANPYDPNLLNNIVYHLATSPNNFEMMTHDR